MQTNFEAVIYIYICIYIYIHTHTGRVVMTYVYNYHCTAQVTWQMRRFFRNIWIAAQAKLPGKRKLGRRNFLLWRRTLASSECGAFQPSGAQNFEVAPRFLEELWASR